MSKPYIIRARELTNESTALGFSFYFTDDFYCFTASFKGAIDTPYEGGEFYTQWKIPNKFPWDPPSIRFISKIFNPNIDPETGYINLNILHKSQWLYVYYPFDLTLLSIQSFLTSFDTECPVNHYAAYLFEKDRAEYVRIAKDWTLKYASGLN